MKPSPSSSLSLAPQPADAKASAERSPAKKRQQWVLQTQDGQFACLAGLSCALTPFVEKAQKWDERDNQQLKAAFWTVQLGQPMTATPLS